MAKLFGSYLDSKRKQAINYTKEWQGFLYSGVVFGATLVVMFWASVFLYTSFYFTYMPQESVTWPIHFQYSSCLDAPGICSNPSAIVPVTDPNIGTVLARGQKYRIVVDLEMPESPVNQRLGMFLISMAMKGHGGELLRQSARSAMLRYRSPLLQTISTSLFAPLLLYGINEEKQMLTVELFSQYEEDPLTPLSEVHIELASRHIEMYAAQLRIHAMFSGLRYFMYQYPLTAAAVGVGICMVFLSAIVILSWYQFSESKSQLSGVNLPMQNGDVPAHDKASQLFSSKQNIPRRISSVSKKDPELKEEQNSTGMGNDDSESLEKDLQKRDANQLPESERRDSDEFEVVNSAKFEGGARQRRMSQNVYDAINKPKSGEQNLEEAVVRQRIQKVENNESVLNQ